VVNREKEFVNGEALNEVKSERKKEYRSKKDLSES
jgi:hypothetical protein